MSPEELDDEMEALQPACANRGRAVVVGAALLSSALFAVSAKQSTQTRARINVEMARKAVREQQDVTKDLYVPTTLADTSHSSDPRIDPCLPTTSAPITKFPSLIQLAAGYSAEGVPYGGVLFSDRGQYAELHGGTDYDLQGMRTNVIAKYDELLANCLTSKGARAADVCEHVYDTQCELDRSDDEKKGQVSCVEDCVNSRFAQFVESEGIVDDASTCAYPVLSGFLLAPNVIKSCIDPAYDATEGGKHASSIAGCYDCVTTCLAGDHFSFICS